MTSKLRGISNHNQPKVLDLLGTHGWNNGFNSPFVDTTNSMLEKKLEEQQRKTLRKRIEVQDIIKHVQDLERHHEATAEDISFARNFNSSLKLDFERETTLALHAERVKKRLDHKVATNEMELMELKTKNQSWFNQVTKRRENVEELLNIIDQNAEMLVIYKRKVEENKNGINAVNVYKNIDKSEVRSVEVKQADLGAANKKLRHDLDQAAMNSSKLHEQFNRLTIEFRKLYKEKKDMLIFWHGCLKAMAKKDLDMQQIATLYFEVKQEFREMESQCQTQEQLLQSFKMSKPYEANHLIDKFDSKIADTREKLSRQRDLLQDYKGNFSQLNIIIKQVTVMMEVLLKQKDGISGKIEGLNDRIKDLENAVSYLQLQRSVIVEQKLTQTDFVKELHKIEAEVSKEIHDSTYKLGSYQTLLRLKLTEFKEFELDEHNLDSSILRTAQSINAISDREEELLIAASKKKTKMYRLDLELSNYEIRISRILNYQIDHRYFKLRATLKEKQEQNIQVHNEIKLTESEMGKLKHLFRAVENDVEHLRRDKKLYINSMNEVVLQFQKNTQENRHLTGQLKEVRVDHSLKLLNKHRVLKTIKRTRENLFSSTQNNISVSSAVKERKSEIKYHLNLLGRLHKQLKSAQTKLAVQIREVQKQVAKVKGRYELTVKLIAFQTEGNPTESNFALMITKLAKEKETLLGEKTKWEHRIDDAMKELEALGNVLTTTKASNQAFKHSLMPAKEESREAKAVANFESNEKKAMVLRHRCNRVKENLRSQTKDLSNQAMVIKQDVDKETFNAEDLKRKLSKIQTEILRLKSRITRWEQQIKRQRPSLVHLSSETIVRIEREIRRKAFATKYDQAISRLHALTKQNNETEIYVKEFLEKRDMLQDFQYRNRMVPGKSISIFSRASTSRSKTRRSTGGGLRKSLPETQ